VLSALWGVNRAALALGLTPRSPRIPPHAQALDTRGGPWGHGGKLGAREPRYAPEKIATKTPGQVPTGDDHPTGGCHPKVALVTLLLGAHLAPRTPGEMHACGSGCFV
jgi:hypothetical protein